MRIDFDSLNEATVIDVIISAKYFSKVYDGVEDKVLCFTQPFGVDKLYADFVYRSTYEDAINDGLLPREELDDLIEKRGLITKEDILREEDLVKRIRGQEALFAKMRFAKNKKEKVGELVTKLRLELSELRVKLNGFYSLSAESIATEAKINYLCWASCYDELGVSRLWDTYSSFNLEENVDFRSEVVSEVLSFLVGFSEKSLRKIARGYEWRIRYISSVKTSLPLLSRNSEDYTKDQIALVYWSNFYQNIYEMLSEDRPTDDIIESDALLDVYMSEYYKSLEQDRLVSGARKKGTDAFNSDEVVVTRFSEMYDKLEYDKPKEASKDDNATDLDIKRSRKTKR